MRGAMLLLLATSAACGFRSVGGDTDVAPDRDANPLASDAKAGASDAALPEPDAAPTRCIDPSLVLCLPFGDALTPILAIDESNAGNDAVATNITTAGRHGNGDAAQFGAGSTLYVGAPMTPFPTDAPFSYAAWVNIAEAPPGGENRWTIVDINDRYALFVHGDDGGDNDVGQPYCTTSGGGGTTSAVSIVGGWHHVACVAAAGKIQIFVDGVATPNDSFGDFDAGTGTACVGTNCTPSGPGSGGNADGLHGALDEIKVWNRALTDAEVCAQAEQDACN